MEKWVWVVLIALWGIMSNCVAQDLRVYEDTARLKQNGIQSISARFNYIGELERYDSLEVLKLEFDTKGHVIREKKYLLFDVILYSKDFRYYYQNGALVKKLEIKEGHPLSKRDSSYAGSGGFKPDTSKWTYTYDEKGKLMTREEYLDNSQPTPYVIASMHYDRQGRLVKEEIRYTKAHKKKLKRSSLQVFTEKDIAYVYNSLGLLEEKEIQNTTEFNQYKTVYTYDSAEQVVSQRHENPKGYGYLIENTYSNGKLVKSHYQRLQDDYFRTTYYEYDQNGRLVKKSETSGKTGETLAMVYQYNEHGWLIREVWKNSEGGEAFSFDYTYRFF